MTIPNFEIVDLQLFFATRPKKILEKDYRLNFWVIIYIIEGRGSHFIDFEKFEYKSGDIIFIQKNQVQRFKTNSEVKGYIMHINEPFLLNLNQNSNNVFFEFIDKSFGSPVISVDNSSESTNKKLIEILYSEYNRNVAEKEDIFIKALFESFVLSLRQQFTYISRSLKTGDYKIFVEFRELVEKYYMKHLTLDEYSKIMGISKKSINQATQGIVDMSAKEFANNQLFLEIKRNLSQGELLNYEIAELLGFVEPANMTKFFKRHEGVSPKVFRENFNI